MKHRYYSAGDRYVFYCIIAQIVLIILKLSGVIDWSWWCVLALIVVPVASIVILICFGVLLDIIDHICVYIIKFCIKLTSHNKKEVEEDGTEG